MKKRRNVDNIEEMIDIFAEMKDEFIDFLDQVGKKIKPEEKKEKRRWRRLFHDSETNNEEINIGMFEEEDVIWISVNEDSEDDICKTEFILKIDDLEEVLKMAIDLRDRK